MASKSKRQRFETEDVGEVTVVRFKDAILDEENIWVIEEQVYGYAEESGRKQLRLDMTQVRFVSSAALGALMTLNRKLKDLGGRLSLCNLNQEMEEVLRATRLDTVLEIYRP